MKRKTKKAVKRIKMAPGKAKATTLPPKSREQEKAEEENLALGPVKFEEELAPINNPAPNLDAH